jgi:hypothetical protein
MEREMTIEELNDQVEKKRGKSDGWPSDLIYMATELVNVVVVKVSVAKSAKNSFWRKIDPWGFAFLDRVKKCTAKPLRLEFELPTLSTPTDPQYEALKRRVSYLAIANKLEISLLNGNTVDKLYSHDELTKRPDCEKVRSDINDRNDNDKPGRLEKDFQAYLFGKGLKNPSDDDIRRTNERLALFGNDFVRIGRIKNAANQMKYKVEREFPTGVFLDEKKESTRILPTEYVDLVTINKNGDLAVIELKLDDSKLEVIPQVLNYALFFHSYRDKLTDLLDKRLGYHTKDAKLVTYLVSNTFHSKFKSVWSYYCQGTLKLKQVIMGYILHSRTL